MKEITYYKTPLGKQPFRDWLETLDLSVKRKVFAYTKRVALGAAKKNIRSLGDGVFEIKMDVGPGYRVYFGELRRTTLVLLLGGDKKSQFRDIQKAKEIWSDYVQKSDL